MFTLSNAQLKLALQQLPHPVLVRLYQHLYEPALRLGFEYYRAQQALPLLHLDALAGFKTSDTVFILGSGSSINAISPERWAQIARHDSFGFNFWMAHPHRPSLYAFEFGSSVWPQFVRLAHERADYAQIPKLITNVHPMAFDYIRDLPRDWRDKIYTAWVVSTLARTRDELDYSVSYLASQDIFTPKEDLSVLFKHRASVVMLISLAHKLGYKHIVLCGIDLNNSAYFYEDAALYPHMTGFRSSQSGAVHATQRAYTWARPVAEVIDALQRVVLSPGGAQLYVENPSSGLHPLLPQAPAHLFA